jgi:hypothetical protein
VTAEELEAKGYKFEADEFYYSVSVAGDLVVGDTSDAVRHQIAYGHTQYPISRIEMLERARQRAELHFVEHRLAS